MMQWAVLISISALLSGCGLGATVSDLLGEEAAPEIPPLTEFASSLEVTEIWSVSVGDGTDDQYLRLAPKAVGDTVFIADRAGEVMAVDLRSGEVRWDQDVEVPIAGGPGAGEGLVLLGTREGEVVALSDADGSSLWTAQVSSEVLAEPRVSSGIVVARTVDGKLFGIDAATGNRLWSYDRQVPVLTLRGTSAPIIVRDLVIAGFDNGGLVALELRTGKVAWEATVAQPSGRTDLERMVDLDADPVMFDDTLYVASYQGRVAAIYPDSGQLLWQQELSSHAGIAVDDEHVYVADDQGRIIALDKHSGRTTWRKKVLHGRAPTAPAASGEYIVVGDVEGYLHWFRCDSGELSARVQVDDSRILVPPLVVDDLVMAYSSGGILGAYRVAGP